MKDKVKGILFIKMFDTHPSVMLLIDPDSKEILGANNSAALFYGYPKDRLIGMYITDINILSAHELDEELKNVLLNKKTCFLFTHKLANGDLRSVEVYAGPVMLEDKKIIFSIVHDITEKKEIQTELESAKIKAEESDRAKSIFLANMSHEIRTPLNSIIGYTEIAVNHELDGETKEYINIIRESSHQLLYIVNEILDFSKIEDGQIEIMEIPFLLEMVLSRINSHSSILLSPKKERIKLVFSISDQTAKYVRGDPVRIEQVMMNLIGNAIKFTENGFIEYGISLKGESELEFYVRDTGIGINQEKQSKIFDRFHQGDLSTSRKYGGTGLGLSISKSLVELMGGELRMTSNVGEEHGSNFYFTVPYKPLNECEYNMNSRIKIEEVKGKYRILVVDDNIVNQKLVKTILEKSGFLVETANDGREAVSKYKTIPSIDLILMDIQMPVLDGYEATLLIRNIEREQDIIRKVPIIALTAHAMKHDMEACLLSGCNDYVTKPVNREMLLNKILMQLEQ